VPLLRGAATAARRGTSAHAQAALGAAARVTATRPELPEKAVLRGRRSARSLLESLFIERMDQNEDIFVQCGRKASGG
jgi:hypothetical protein